MNKILYTFFFGYISLKWRRLVRTLIILTALTFIVFLAFHIIIGEVRSDIYVDGFWFNMFFLPILGYIILIALISWLVKPFVVKEG